MQLVLIQGILFYVKVNILVTQYRNEVIRICPLFIQAGDTVHHNTIADKMELRDWLFYSQMSNIFEHKAHLLVQRFLTVIDHQSHVGDYSISNK
jgi:hypothetical protein